MSFKALPEFKHIPDWVWECVDKSKEAQEELSWLYDGEPDVKHALLYLNLLAASPDAARPTSEREWQGLHDVAMWLEGIRHKSGIDYNDFGTKLLGMVGDKKRPWTWAMKQLELFRNEDYDSFFSTFEDENLVRGEHIDDWYEAIYQSILMGPTGSKKPSSEILGHLLKTAPLDELLQAVAEYQFEPQSAKFRKRMHAIRGHKLPAWPTPTPPLRHQGRGKTTLVFCPSDVSQLKSMDRLSEFCIADIGLASLKGQHMIAAFLPEATATTILGRPIAREAPQREADMDYVIKHLNVEQAKALTVLHMRADRPKHNVVLSHADGEDPNKDAIQWYLKVLETLPYAKARRAEYRQISDRANALPANDWSDQPYDPSVPSQAAKAFKAGRPLSPTKEGRKASSVEEWVHVYELERFVRSDVQER